jgi:sirohydrochlorin ferrochelatase
MRVSSVFSPGSAPSRSVSRPSIASRGRSSRACGRGRPLARAEARDAAGGVGEKLGVVIVDHGSRRKASNDLLEEFVRMYREQTGRPIVELAHMEIAEPDIDTAFGRCVEQGATLVAISPFFLSPGRHWQEDIPALAAEAAAKHPGVGHFVAAPIGMHPLMAEIVDSRLETCLAHLTDGGASRARQPAANSRRQPYAHSIDQPYTSLLTQAASVMFAMGRSSAAP